MWKAEVGKKNVHHPWSFVLLLAAIAIAIGPKIAEMESWSVATTPAFFGSNLHLVAGVVVGWVSQFVSKKS